MRYGKSEVLTFLDFIILYEQQGSIITTQFMALVWITTTIGIISTGFCLMSIKLLYRYINRYRFDESKYTLLFGFIRLRYIAAAYIIFSVTFAVISTIFIIYTIL